MINSICGGVRMNFSLVTIIDEDLNQYKADMQEAFQKGFEDVFGKTEDIILPEKDIDNSLNQLHIKQLLMVKWLEVLLW